MSAEDEFLVVRCQLGERPAFDELIERWHGPIWTYLRRTAGDAQVASDLSQDTWLRVLRGIHRLRDGSKLRGWLFGIARRALMDRLRDKYATPHTDVIDLADLARDETAPDLDDDLAAMEYELAQLPVVERDVLTLFYLRDLSLADVADVLAVPVGTVKSRLFRARRLLRTELDARRSRA